MFKEVPNNGEERNVPDPTSAHREGGPSYSYRGYLALGGRIDEATYNEAMAAVSDHVPEKPFTKRQVNNIAGISEISLDNIQAETGIDPVVIYDFLRHHKKPADAQFHHGAMFDQQLMVEALRMLEQEDAVKKIIEKHDNLSFS